MRDLAPPPCVLSHLLSGERIARFCLATADDHDAGRTGLRFGHPQPSLFLTCSCPVQGLPRCTWVNYVCTNELTGRRVQAKPWCVSIRTPPKTIRISFKSFRHAFSRPQIAAAHGRVRSARSFSFSLLPPLVVSFLPVVRSEFSFRFWTRSAHGAALVHHQGCLGSGRRRLSV